MVVATLLLGMGGVVAVVMYQEDKAQANALSVLGGGQVGSNNHEIKISTLSNRDYEMKFVIIRESGRDKPIAKEPVHGVTTWSSDAPLVGLKSTFQFTSSQDPQVSGVWIDGEKQEIQEHVRVYYISDRVAAFEVPYDKVNEQELIKAVKSSEPAEFIENWVEPYLP